VVGDVGANVSNQQGDSRDVLVPAAASTSASAASKVRRRSTSAARWAVLITASRTWGPVGIVIRIVVGRRTATGTSPGRPVVVAAAPIEAGRRRAWLEDKASTAKRMVIPTAMGDVNGSNASAIKDKSALGG